LPWIGLIFTLYIPRFIRALKTISLREEEEKLNVWVAYLNLENEYGSPREVTIIPLLGLSASMIDYTDFTVLYEPGCCQEGIPKSIAIL
jgi:hypothetical protein